jgi:pimeloyl-ACP methyl ester carboxylesterase
MIRSFSTHALACALVLASASSHAGQANHVPPAKANIVLVHGAFVDGSSWAPVVGLLQSQGYHVTSVQDGLSSLDDDVQATINVLAQQNGPVVLVGHSWGGAVISQAGNDPRVKALVYVAAFAPDKGESINDLLAGAPPAAWTSSLTLDGSGRLTMAPESFTQYFAPDLPRAVSGVLAAGQVGWAAAELGTPLSVAAWHNKPSFWVMTKQDQIIPYALQSKMAQRAGGQQTAVQSSHSVILSHPVDVARVIVEAADSIR